MPETRIRVAWMDVGVAPRATVEADVKPLIVAANSPWRFMGQEVLAYYDLRHGATQKGQKPPTTTYLKAPNAPQGVKVRAAAFSEYIRANPDLDFAKNSAIAPPSPAQTHSGQPRSCRIFAAFCR